jgi:hypothetical protein
MLKAVALPTTGLTSRIVQIEALSEWRVTRPKQ